MEIKTSQQSNFFGKDNLVSFIGIVEDVNDPKSAGRVKVRCVGWHPKDKEELSTEDLPWSRVSAPTTHAQQNRVGSKHGLLPGCWVWGFFLDGNDGNNAMVCGSFPFTAGVAKEDNRDRSENSDPGTQDKSKNAFMPDTQPRHPNTAVVTPEEKQSKNTSDPKDKGGDAPALLDAKSNDCGELMSQDNKSKTEELGFGGERKQDYDVARGDGGCGNIPHASIDAQKLMKETMPSKDSRFEFGDVVWNSFTGSFIDMNGIINKIAMDMTAKVQMLVLQNKATQEDKMNRTMRSSQLNAGTLRDMVSVILSDESGTIKDDVFHMIIMQFLSQLQGQLMKMIQETDKNNGSGLVDPAAKCVADAIITNVEIMMDDATKLAESESQEYVDSLGLRSYTPEDVSYTNVDIVQNEYDGWGDYDVDQQRQVELLLEDDVTTGEKKNKKLQEESEKENPLEQFGNILSQLGSVQGIMSFSMMDKYAIQGAKSHNQVGNSTQAKRTQDGSCQVERIYNTVTGIQKSIQSMSSDVGQSSSPSSALQDFAGVGFGGVTPGTSKEFTNQSCEEAVNPPQKPKGKYVNAKAISLPSGEVEAARNFSDGVPNVVVIKNPGEGYFFNNELEPEKAFPSIYIPGYFGTPVPIVDRETGQLVAITTNPRSFDRNLPNPAVSIIPGTNTLGYTTDNENYSFVISGVHIANTGFAYTEDCEVIVTDLYTGRVAAELGIILKEGRIVDVEIINSGINLRRIPNIRIRCGTGYGAKLYPIISMVPRSDSKLLAPPVSMVFCPGKNQLNLV